MIALILLFQIAVPVPGSAWTQDTARICHQPTRAVRRVSEAVRRQILYRDTGSDHPPQRYELDHLIPLGLGGSNRERNLWAEPWADAQRKDRLESQLHWEVCSGRLPIGSAQERMRRWSP